MIETIAESVFNYKIYSLLFSRRLLENLTKIYPFKNIFLNGK